MTEAARVAAIAVIAICGCSLCYAADAEGAATVVVDSIEVKVLFPIGFSAIDLSYRQNGERLAEFVECVNAAQADPSMSPSRIIIKGYASPDGDYRANKRLADNRARNLAAYLRSQISLPDSLMQVEGVGIDWDGLCTAVGLSSLPNKATVQDIILNEPVLTLDSIGVPFRSRKQVLMNLDGGRTWNWMMEHLYPALRSSASVVCYIVSEQAIAEIIGEGAQEEALVEIDAELEKEAAGI